MKKLLLLLFSLILSFNSYGELTKVSRSVDKDSYYIYTDTIRENNGYVYWWDLTDFIEPGPYLKGNDIVWTLMSIKTYSQGDCGVFRYKMLSHIDYEQSMAKGKGKPTNFSNSEWKYPPPGSVSETILNFACDYVD
tara:strand:+ start:30 stop:437 length:408 start_codon:yes stop_codon:yes gene_type:complete